MKPRMKTEQTGQEIQGESNSIASAASTSPVLELKSASKAYGDHKALSNIDFAVEPGEWWGIVGPNGSGKSTLLHLLSGVLVPTEGSVFIKDKPVRNYSRKELSRIIAVLQQDGLPEIAYSVRDVVSMGRYPYQDWLGRDTAGGDEVVDRVLEQLELVPFADRPLDELSGGQRQRVALAKVMAQEPEILLLDEPTTYLDVHYQLQFMELLADWRRSTGITIVAVLHDLNLASLFCDKLYGLKAGVRFMHGKPDPFVSEDNLKQLFQIEPVMIRHPDHEVPQFLLKKRG
ncbi:ABC transporter ATP-binding protein [Neobacillus mesonae]|nr:ABC transporter ATP-binding protein [Neobacillus mesonae]